MRSGFSTDMIELPAGNGNAHAFALPNAQKQLIL